ncbi:hypothetical protein TNCV_543431 [Trichonephila clavipes]|nr:hypothetical protein TNCV_543431 [Trichonephila clavipes]
MSGREELFLTKLRHPPEEYPSYGHFKVTNDFRAIIDNENFVPEITPYLKRFARISSEVCERIEEKPYQRKIFYDKRHRPGPLYRPGNKV